MQIASKRFWDEASQLMEPLVPDTAGLDSEKDDQTLFFRRLFAVIIVGQGGLAGPSYLSAESGT